MRDVPEGGRRLTEKRYYGAAYARLHSQGLAKTLTRYFANAGSGRFWHPSENRSLTVREAARLQGFDDGFQFPGGAREANAWMIGNALDKGLADASFGAVRRLVT
jgi:DNA (cytosine-5)-methyltransferase 1